MFFVDGHWRPCFVSPTSFGTEELRGQYLVPMPRAGRAHRIRTPRNTVSRMYQCQRRAYPCPPINVRVSEAGMMRSPFRRSSLHVYTSVPMAPISHPRHTPSLTWKRMLRRRARTIWDPLWRRPPIPILMDALSRYRCHNAHVGDAVPSIN